METKHALIIGISIVLGFSIEPLSKLDFSDPSHRLIQVVDTTSWRSDGGGYYHSYEMCIRAGSTDWDQISTGRWVSKGGFYPANEHALRTIMEIYGN